MAVYTEVHDDELNDFVNQFNIGNLLSYKGIAEGVENTNFILYTESGPFILTLYEKRVNENDLPFFLGLMDHLSKKGINCPLPLQNKDGQTLGRLAGRPAAIFTFLQGMWPRKIQPFHCQGLGGALAHLHLAGQDFEMRRPNTLGIAGWRPLFEKCIAYADDVKPGLCDELAAELDLLEANWRTDLPKGIMHADAFPDNVFFKGQEYRGLIDFYFACEDLFVLDLVICMNSWCFEKIGEFNVTKTKLLLANYSKVRPLSGEEINALPIIARGAAMRFLLTRLYDWVHTPKDALVKPKDPMEYYKTLKFHQAVTSPQAYGID